MKKVLFITLLGLFAQNMIAANITYYYPEGWKCENVALSDSSVNGSPTNGGEIAYVPPYYYTRSEEYSYSYEKNIVRKRCSVVTSLAPYRKAGGQDGWVVKAPKNWSNWDVSPNGLVLDDGSSGAFRNCINLKKVVLPPTIKKIGNYAFENCNLTELVCMAVIPPALADSAFTRVAITKIIVPKGTLSSYKSASGWKDFTLEEGAEAYSDYQMVEYNGAWYEVNNGEAALISSRTITDPMMPTSIDYFFKGEIKNASVTSIRDCSIYKSVTLNDNIVDIPADYGTGQYHVSSTHPTLRQLTERVISNKKGTIAYDVYGEAVVPHGITTIANNSLTNCTLAYLPTTLTFLGRQTKPGSLQLYFTSEQPPTTTASETVYRIYFPSIYKDNYNRSAFNFKYQFWTLTDIPAGYENLITYNPDGAISEYGYWNTKDGTCILKGHCVEETDIDDNGIFTPPTYLYLNETMQGPIVEYDYYYLSGSKTKSFDKTRIPEGAKILSAFDRYQSELYLPSTLEKCCPLYEYSYLKVIKVSPNNPILDSRENCNAVIETATNTLLAGCTSSQIPSTIERIGDNAFRGPYYSGTKLTIPASVKSIGKFAFRGFGGPTTPSIEFAPSSQLTCIEDSAFVYSSITKMTLPDGLKQIGVGAFERCEGLKTISFGNSLKQIGAEAFSETALNSIILPDALETIGDYAFSNVPTLETVKFGNSLKEIGYYAFHNTAWYDTWYETQPDGVVYLGKTAYTYKGDMPKNATVSLNDKTEGIAGGAFSNCWNLSSIYIPKTVTSIGKYAFYGCWHLNSIDIPNGVTTIREGTFSGCSNLPSITIPNSVVSIEQEAFKGCYSLKSIDIPNSVIAIGDNAFYNCSGLTSVMSHIEDPYEIDPKVFYYKKDYSDYSYSKFISATLYVPKECRKKYQETKGWNLFENIIEYGGNEIDPTEKDQEIAFKDIITENMPLTDIIIEDTYYNLNSENGDKYDDSEGCIVLNTQTADEAVDAIIGKEIGDMSIKESFNGIIFMVPAGSGIISVTAETLGANTLKIKVGNNSAQVFQLTERDDAQVSFKVSEPTYVYIYIGINSSQAKNKSLTTSSSDSSAKIYSYSWNSNKHNWQASVVKGDDKTMVYGDNVPALTYKVEGDELGGTPHLQTVATHNSPVGTYDIVVSQGTVQNPNVTYQNGTLTITKAPLTISAGNYTMKQGEALPEFKASYKGWKNNETESVLTKKPTLTTTATSQSEPGTYDVVASDAEAQNYAITYVNGILTIEENTTRIAEISVSHPVDVYTLQGQKVRSQATDLKGLPAGIYIVNGHKIRVE